MTQSTLVASWQKQSQAASAVLYLFVFFFNDTATTEIYTLSLHDALPILAIFTRRVPVENVKTLKA